MPDSSADPIAATGTSYSAFISYSHQDAKTAAWLQSAIERYVVPKRLVGRVTAVGAVPRRLGKCFRDRDELPASPDLKSEILKAIDQSRFLIVLCSPAAARSPWVNEEIIAFKLRRGADRVIAVITAGEPFAPPAAADQECFPAALRFQIDDSGAVTNRPAEPIAADLRDDKDGRRGVQLKVLAGMLGLGLDELAQREAQRKQVIYGWMTAAALVTATAFASLALIAWQQRNIALAATSKAAERRAQAEGLLEFMIEDLRNKLFAVGKTDLLDAVTDRALVYFASLSPDEIDDDAAGQKTRVLGQIGNQQMTRGQQKQALETYSQAWQAAQSALRKAPDNPSRLYEYGLTQQNLGYYYFMSADLSQAERYFIGAIEAYHRAISAEKNKLWQKELAKTEKNLGVTFLNQMNFPRAISQFNEAQNIFNVLMSEEPENDVYVSGYADVLAWKADSLRLIGNTSEAIQLRKTQLGLYQNLLAKNPSDKQVAMREIVGWHGLALLKTDAGDYAGSYKDLSEIETEIHKIYEFDPKNMSLLSRWAEASFDMAHAAISMGDLSAAQSSLQKANQSYQVLISSVQGPSRSATRLKALSEYLNCYYWNTAHQFEKTLAVAQPRIDGLEKQKIEKAVSQDALYELYYALMTAYLGAEALTEQNQSHEAIRIYQLINDRIEALPEPRSVIFEAIHAKILPRLGRLEDAKLSLALVCRGDYRRVIGVNGCKE